MTARRVGVLTMALLVARAAGAVEITACGQVLRAGEIGQLRRDLDCAVQPPTWPFSATGVRMEDGATLHLNGFTIRGDGSGVGVTCSQPDTRRATCTVNGPGTISGFWAGLNGGGCLFVVRGIVLERNTNGIVGPLACDLRAEQVNVIDNTEHGIWVARMRGRDLVVSGNGGSGLLASRLNVHGLAATGNGGEGVRQSTIRGRFGRIAYSTVIANGVNGPAYDIAAAGWLRLVGVRCGRSAKLRYPPVVDSSDDVPRVVGSFGCVND